jgi:hypothetical protein
MGLLDDAIREHLELKRRRGADPGEVARQEGEALGDPRTGAFAGPQAAPAAPESLAAEDEEPPAPAAHEPEPEPELEPPPVRESGEEEPWLGEDRGDAGSGQPTPEFNPPDVEPEVVRPDDEPAADEDVLEETPDFLQETPEHDRLWFEQKPPRDFDFDS